MADTPAVFVFALQNCNFEIVGDNSRSFGNSQTKTISMEVTSSQAGNLEQYCKLKVYDQTDPSKYSTATVHIIQKETKYCEEGQQIVIGNIIKECQNGEYVIIERCKNGVKYNASNGKYYCSEGAVTKCKTEGQSVNPSLGEEC